MNAHRTIHTLVNRSVQTCLDHMFAVAILDTHLMQIIKVVMVILEKYLSLQLYGCICLMLDVDECMTQPVGFSCTQNHTCINNDGSYGCICKSGYAGTAISCLGELIVKSIPL